MHIRAQERSFALILVSRQTFMAAAWKPTRSASITAVKRPGTEPPTPLDAQKGAAGLVWAVKRRAPPSSKIGRARAERTSSAQGTAPSALPGSAAMLGCFSHQSHALTYHPQRAYRTRLAADGVPNS